VVVKKYYLELIVNGIDTYERYLPLIKMIKENFSQNDAAKVLGFNSMTIFNLPVVLK
jgi:hypothetical protein